MIIYIYTYVLNVILCGRLCIVYAALASIANLEFIYLSVVFYYSFCVCIGLYVSIYRWLSIAMFVNVCIGVYNLPYIHLHVMLLCNRLITDVLFLMFPSFGI